MLQHKHVLIRAAINNPITNEEVANEWLRELIDAIGMKILMGPYSAYVDVPGNKGLTCAAIIETSHIVAHFWDEEDPAIVQFDIYTCGSLDLDVVFAFMKRLDPEYIDYKFIDREYGFDVVIDKGRIE